MPWRLMLLTICVLLVALVAAWQAVTIAWLSSFQEWADQLRLLEIKFWSYAAVAAILLIIDVGLIVRLMRRLNEKEPSESV